MSGREYPLEVGESLIIGNQKITNLGKLEDLQEMVCIDYGREMDVKLKVGQTPEECQVWLNGKDITMTVRGFDVHAHIGEISRVTLEFFPSKLEIESDAEIISTGEVTGDGSGTPLPPFDGHTCRTFVDGRCNDCGARNGFTS